MTIDILALLAEDRDLVSYRKSLRKLTGSVTSAILLQQVLYWFTRQGYQTFYKFKEPCNHKLYKPGDSWTEELGFSKREFDGALKRIGTKITSGKKKTALLEGRDITNVVLYWIGNDRVTWYEINADLLVDLLKRIYYVKHNLCFTMKSTNCALHVVPETTAETTADSIVNLDLKNPDYLDEVLTKQGKVSESTGPNPDDQWLQYRDDFLVIYQQSTGQTATRIEKETVVELSNEPDASVDIWRESWKQAILNWSGQATTPPLQRVIEIYRAGGDYEKFAAKKWGNHKNQNEVSIK